MPATSQPTDQPSGQVIKDEGSLEKLFRAHYPALLTEAKSKLPGAETGAPRVVSKAFHMAWNDRSQFRSTEELLVFLKASIQHGAAREISRRAGLKRADHMISGSTHEDGHAPAAHHEISEMSVDEAWERLQHTLHGGVPEAYRKRASISRHEAAEHVAALGKERSYTPLIGAAAVVLALLLGLSWFLQKQGEGRRVGQALSASDARNYETGANQMVNITLDDGTVVRVGPQTKVTIPKNFGASLRAVRVAGAANFNVTQTLAKPFEVRAGDVSVIARGTTFTVRRYPEDSSVIVKVSEGTVDVMRGTEVRNVAEGMSLKVVDGGAISVPSGHEIDEASTWVDGNVTIAGRQLRYILPQLKRYYGLDVKVVDRALLDRQVFLRAALNSPREAITSVEKSAGVKFTYVGENMTFADTAPSRATKAPARATKRP